MVVRQKGDECLILSKPCPAFDAHLDDRNYVYATASITFWRREKERGGRERAHDTRRLLYAAGIFIPKTECNFFFDGLQNARGAVFFFSSGSPSSVGPREIKYFAWNIRVSSSYLPKNT